MKIKSKVRKHISVNKGDSYMALIERHPLRPIRNEQEHDAAVEMVGELIGHKLDDGASDYLDTLILLVNKYEDERHTPGGWGVGGGEMTPREALRAIMEFNGLSQADIGKIIGSESAVSMFFKGERELSKAHIKALAERFRVDAGLFM